MQQATLTLVRPTLELREAFLALVQEFHDAGEGYFTGLSSQGAVDFPAYLQRLRDAETDDRLPSGLVPQSTFWLVRDGEVIGVSSLRHRLTPLLKIEGGHIGYMIRPSERRKGYGTLILALMLAECRTRGYRRVMVTCNTDNIGSARIIQKNGGEFEGEAPSPTTGILVSRYWIHLE